MKNPTTPTLNRQIKRAVSSMLRYKNMFESDIAIPEKIRISGT